MLFRWWWVAIVPMGIYSFSKSSSAKKKKGRTISARDLIVKSPLMTVNQKNSSSSSKPSLTQGGILALCLVTHNRTRNSTRTKRGAPTRTELIRAADSVRLNEDPPLAGCFTYVRVAIAPAAPYSSPAALSHLLSHWVMTLKVFLHSLAKQRKISYVRFYYCLDFLLHLVSVMTVW